MDSVRGSRLAPVIVVGALVALASVVAGCGSSSAPVQSTATTYPLLRPPTPAAPHHHQTPDGARIGQTQRVHAAGTVLSVTISRLVDPLRDSGASLVPGTRAIGVEAVVADDGAAGYDSSSTGDFSVITSAGAARPVFAATGVCQTPLRDWDNEISPGESRSGCVAFALPAGARVMEVRFSPHAQARGRVMWAAAR